MRKGKMIYVPPNLLEEVDNLMAWKGIKKRSKALNEFTNFARVGMEAERIIRLDFSPIRRKK